MRIGHEIQERHGLEIERMGADSDHTPLLCSVHPEDKYQVQPWADREAVQEHRRPPAFKALPRPKKDLWGSEFRSMVCHGSEISGKPGHVKRQSEGKMTYRVQ